MLVDCNNPLLLSLIVRDIELSALDDVDAASFGRLKPTSFGRADEDSLVNDDERDTFEDGIGCTGFAPAMPPFCT